MLGGWKQCESVTDKHRELAKNQDLRTNLTYALGGPNVLKSEEEFVPESVETQCVNGTNYKMTGSIGNFNITVQFYEPLGENPQITSQLLDVQPK